MNVKKAGIREIRNASLAEARQIALHNMDKASSLEAVLEELQAELEKPIQLILFCPICRCRHIDEGIFASRPHKSHACQGCGFVWSPSHRNTVGVEFLPGYRNRE